MKIYSSLPRDLLKRYCLFSSSSNPLLFNLPLHSSTSLQLRSLSSTRRHTFSILPPLYDSRSSVVSSSSSPVQQRKFKRNKNPPDPRRVCLQTILKSSDSEERIRSNLRRYMDYYKAHLTFPDLVYFLNETSRSHIRIPRIVLLQCGELFNSAPGNITKEFVDVILKSFQTFSHLNAQKVQFLRRACDKIVTCRREELGIFDGDNIGLWIGTIRHLQRRGYSADSLIDKLSLQLQFTFERYEAMATNSTPLPLIDFLPIVGAFYSSEDLLKQKKIPLIGDLARLLPFYDLSHLTASDIAKFIPHLYASCDEQTALHVRLFFRNLLPPLLNSTQTTTPVRLNPTEVTDILTSMKSTSWLSALEYDMLAFLSREMNFEVSTTPTYPLRALCSSLHGLRGQYLDSPGIESLLSSIAAQFRKYLTFNSQSQQYEVTNPASDLIWSYDLGAAFFGLNKMPDTSPSLIYLLRTMTPFLRSSLEQKQHVTLKTISSCLMGLSRMNSDCLEVSTLINLIADCFETNREPLNPVTVAHLISSLQRKSLDSDSVERFWRIFLAKLGHNSLEFTPEQVLHMIIGTRSLKPSHHITESLQDHLIRWIERLDRSSSPPMTPERFSQLLSLMSSMTTSGSAMALWLQYLRNQMRPSDPSGPAPFQLQSSSQVVQCIDGLALMKSEHRSVRKFLRDLSLVIYQSRDVVLTENDLTKCYVTLQWMNKDYVEVEKLLQVLDYKRSVGKRREEGELLIERSSWEA